MAKATGNIMRVLITGGSGLIGRALSANLARDGNEVIILSRRPERITDLPLGVRAEGWDGRTIEGWHSLADGADAIVNLAGENISSGRWTEKRKQAILQSRLNAGQAVVQAVKVAARKPRIVIQASGIGYYGPHDDEEITEETPPGHDFLAQLAAQIGNPLQPPWNRWGCGGPSSAPEWFSVPKVESCLGCRYCFGSSLAVVWGVDISGSPGYTLMMKWALFAS